MPCGTAGHSAASGTSRDFCIHSLAAISQVQVFLGILGLQVIVRARGGRASKFSPNALALAYS